MLVLGLQGQFYPTYTLQIDTAFTKLITTYTLQDESKKVVIVVPVVLKRRQTEQLKQLSHKSSGQVPKESSERYLSICFSSPQLPQPVAVSTIAFSLFFPNALSSFFPSNGLWLHKIKVRIKSCLLLSLLSW